MQTIVERENYTAQDDIESRGLLGREEQKHRFVELRAKGHSYARIAKELGVSKGTLVNWNAELKTEIAQARSIELEALQEEFYLLKEGRIRLLGDSLKPFRLRSAKPPSQGAISPGEAGATIQLSGSLP